MGSDIAFPGSFTTSCKLRSFASSSVLRLSRLAPKPRHRTRPSDWPTFASKELVCCDYDVMSRLPRFLKPLTAGLTVTLLQLAMTLGLLAPEEPISHRYSTLAQHDSGWFINIIDRGYQTIVPPIDHKVMEVSNVAFFPAYPAIAALFRYGLNIDTGTALLIVAQLAAWGFWIYFFLFCKRWNISPALQVCGSLLIVTHPAAFFLIAGYSESLFLTALLGFIYWSSAQGRAAKFWAALHGIVMSATRIVGIVCAAFPVVRSVFAKVLARSFPSDELGASPAAQTWRSILRSWASLRESRRLFRQHAVAIGLMIVATLGALSFFLYCQLRWGHWDIYMLTQAAGWGIVPDYLAVFRPSNYRWLVPALNNPTEASQMSMTLGALLFVGVALCEISFALRRARSAAIRWRTELSIRAGIYFCAAAIYYLSVSGVACVDMESMLRYEFCVHALIVLALLNYLRQLRMPPMFVRALGIAAVALISAAGLSVQGWYVWNFTRGNWVA